MIPIFQELSKKVGKDRVIWRYAPVFLNDRYTKNYHLKAFREIAGSLKGYTEKVVISFLDFYAKTQKNTEGLKIKKTAEQEMIELAKEMVKIAEEFDLAVETCAEQIDLGHVGIEHASCIDKKLIEKIIGCKLKGGKDKHQREECGCLESVEVGTYDTCQNGCRYCYTNFNWERVKAKINSYDIDSLLLCGKIEKNDKITERKVRSLREPQISLFDDRKRD